MRILDLARNDLRQLMRDRKAFIFLLALPIIFTLLIGFAFGGDNASDPRLPIGVRDEDGGELAREIMDRLAASQVVRVETSGDDAAALAEQVGDEALAAAVIIPAGFGAQMRRGDPLPVTVIASGQAGLTVEGEVQTAVSRIAAAAQAARISTETAVDQGMATDAAAQQAHYDQALAQALAAWETPPATITATASGALADEAGEQVDYSAYAHSSPGMMAQFAIAGLISAAGILVAEKKTRSLQRLLTTNLTRGEILLGHFLAMCVMIFLQLITLIVFGQLALGLPYFAQPGATLAVTVATTLFAASMGLLIGVVAKKEEQVIVFSLLPMFVLSALGGAWVPLEFTPEAFQQVAFVTPLAWVIDAYKDILVRGQGLNAVATGVAVLLGYAAVLGAFAVWRFRAD